MTAQASHNMPPPQVEDPQPDLATFMMARAIAEMYQSEPDCPMPRPLAAILRQMESWETDHVDHVQHAGRVENVVNNKEPERPELT
jgi:hypothetical protein